MNLRSVVLGAAVLLLTAGNARADATWELAVQASADVATAPPAITLRWAQDSLATPTSYAVMRKGRGDKAWGDPVMLPGTATSWVDSAVAVGAAYEYQIVKSSPLGYPGYGYVYAGIDAPLVDDRGRVLLVVDNANAAALATELARLVVDLVGDGWTVTRIDVAREDSPASVRQAIQKAYADDPKRTNAVFLFGHVPVPYSGDIDPDGHPEHRGAWPADVYYGDVDGQWTDTDVTSTSGESPRNRNVPGDGKLDQSQPPGDVELAVGRVDLANMPGRTTWDGPPTFPSEVELLRRYLEKDHAFRYKKFSPARRGLVRDGFGSRDGEGFAASGWRNFSAFFGHENVRDLPQAGTFLSTLASEDYLWAYGSGAGSPGSIAGIGSYGQYLDGRTLDVVQTDPRAAFFLVFGSWLGDWDSEDNVMRSFLATPTMGLASAWSGRPHWFLHGMALGETIGEGARLTQNNRAGLYKNQIDTAAAGVHVALMGDPTLRMHTVAPPSSVKAASASAGVEVTIGSSPDAAVGYHVYRAATASGPFVRLTQEPIAAPSWTDPQPNAEQPLYMVRAVVREQSGSGTYFNASQGVVARVDGVIATPGGEQGIAGSAPSPGTSTTSDAGTDTGCALATDRASRPGAGAIALLLAAAVVRRRRVRRAASRRTRA